MAFREWRRFNFFDLIDNVDKGVLANAIQDARITTSTCGQGHLVFGDSEGIVHLVDRLFEVTSFHAYEYRVELCEQIRNAPLLVTVGGDEPGAYPIIKVWSLEKRDKGGLPTCVRVSRATYRGHTAQVTTICTHSNLELMAIGFSDFSVILYRGDITRDRSVKQQILGGKDFNYGFNNAVTGLAFRSGHGVKSINYLFVATVSGVYIYNISVKDKEHRVTLDNGGCEKMCSLLAENAQEGQFMVGRTDAIYCYTPDGRGSCYVIGGEKVLLQWFRSYLVIVAKDEKKEGNVVRSAATVSHHQRLKGLGEGEASKSGLNNAQKRPEKCMVNILDILNKFIVLSVPMNGVQAVLSEWGSIYVVHGGGGPSEPLRLCHLAEKNLQSKLASLFKKNLYDVSIRIAKSQQYDVDGLVDIFRQYGDHLYAKGDHNAAIEQYIRTIGKLESSYVIRKFLDSQHIGHLTKYLQALHKQGMASEDHTTLLLNCYTKQDSTEKLKEFLMTKDREVDFDVEIAIKVCREASPEDALLLACKHHLHQWYLKILIEDQHNYTQALDYIAQLDFEEAEENMKEYGSILVEHVPQQATELLKKLCYEYRSSKRPLVDQNMLDGTVTVPETKAAKAEEFIHLFLNNSEQLVEFLEHIVSVCQSCSTQVYNTLVEHYLHVWSSIVKRIESLKTEGEDGAEKKDEEKLQAEKKHWEKKLMELLENPDSIYDKNQTLILCRVHSFKMGLIYLYEDAKLYQEIINYHAQHGDYRAILECCRKFGHKDLELWVQALWLCAQYLPPPPLFLREVLEVIAREQLLSPLLVVDALSSGNGVNVGMTAIGEIRSFLLSVLSSEGEIIEKERTRVAKYLRETMKFREKIKDIQTNTMIFQGSRCSVCDNQLCLPAIYFLCQHAYHRHCFQSFSENENDCPVCLPKYKKNHDFIESQEQSLNNHQAFHTELERAEDGFTWVAEYFGRGIFNRLTLVTDLPSKSGNQGKSVTGNVRNTYDHSTETRLKSHDGKTPKRDSRPDESQASAVRVGETKKKQDGLSLLQKATAGGSARESTPSNFHDKQMSKNITSTIPLPSQLGLSTAQIQYSGSLEANMTRGSDYPPQSLKPNLHGRSDLSRNKSVPSTNPFGDDDDDTLNVRSKGEPYDERKNPFANESNNPFECDVRNELAHEEADSNYCEKLNPFA